MAAINDHIARGGANTWPDLRYDDWKDTCATLQLWTQIVGKVRLKLAPMVNHWWQVALYVTASGLTTSAMPYQGRFVQIDFDFLAHRLLLRTSDGRSEQFALQPCSVADFYAEVMKRLRALGVESASGPCRPRSRAPSRSSAIARTPPTTATPRSGSGASWCRPTA